MQKPTHSINNEFMDFTKGNQPPISPVPRPRSRWSRLLGLMTLCLATAVAETKDVSGVRDAKSLYEQAISLLENPKSTTTWDEGIRLLKTSAEQGHAEAQNRMGYICERGLGTPKDEAGARTWFSKAAASGLAKAEFNYGRFLVLGVGGDKNISEGITMLEKSAAQGIIPANLALGQSYFFGEYGRNVDYAKAYPFFLAAAEAGNAEAQNFMGTMCSYGNGVKLSKERAAQWYLRAANQGHAKAQASIADLYLTGTGIKLDKAEAIKFYTLSAKQGEVTGVNPLETLMPDMDPKIISEGTKRAEDFKPTTQPAEPIPAS